MPDRFDLEEKIMNCWNVVNDIESLTENIGNGQEFAGLDPKHQDRILNVLVGLSELYAMKFDSMFQCFEELVHSGVFPDFTGQQLGKINRLEVIDQTGRAYVNTRAHHVFADVQDQGKTLKIFTRGDQDRGSTETS